MTLRRRAVSAFTGLLFLLTVGLSVHPAEKEAKVYQFSSRDLKSGVPVGEPPWQTKEAKTTNGTIYCAPADKPESKIFFWTVNGIAAGDVFLTFAPGKIVELKPEWTRAEFTITFDKKVVSVAPIFSMGSDGAVLLDDVEMVEVK